MSRIVYVNGDFVPEEDAKKKKESSIVLNVLMVLS